MEEKPSGNRPAIPTWVWILGIFAVILGLQLWLSGRFSGPDQIGLDEAMAMIESGEVETITITGSSLKLTMKDGTEVGTTFDSRSSPEEVLTYFGITDEVLAENRVEWINNDQSAWKQLVHHCSLYWSSAALDLDLYPWIQANAGWRGQQHFWLWPQQSEELKRR